MSINVATAPSGLPVTKTEFKALRRLDGTDEDDMIDILLEAATDAVEKHTGYALITRTLDLYMDRWKDDRYWRVDEHGKGAIRLPYPPTTSVTHIKYQDQSDTQQTWSSDDYDTDFITHPARISLGYSASWPAVRDERNTIVIRYVTGYANAAAVPEGFNHCILQLAAHWHKNREPVSDKREMPIPYSLHALLNQTRIRMFG